MNIKPSLRSLIDQPEENDEEHFVDIPSDEDEDEKQQQLDLKKNKKRKFASPQPIKSSTNDRIYDGRKRDPKYCNADQTCIWELVIIVF